jgi:hypothetical protein
MYSMALNFQGSPILEEVECSSFNHLPNLCNAAFINQTGFVPSQLVAVVLCATTVSFILKF